MDSVEKLWSWFLAIASAAFAGLLGLVWKQHRTEIIGMREWIDSMQKEIDQKATREELHHQRGNISALFEHQRDDRELFVKMMREDKREIVTAISGVQLAIDSLRNEVTRELLARPTRDELYKRRKDDI